MVEAHLIGKAHIGLYPLLRDDTCHWLAVDFDGPAAMLDALAYLKAARAIGVPAALEVSRSGLGDHVWIFFTGPVPATTVRTLGSGLVREAIALRGTMNLATYDRLFPSQDVLPAGKGIGNLIAAPLHGRTRRQGATVLLDLATMEPHPDQWAFLSSLHRLSPRDVERLAKQVARPTVGAAVTRLEPATASRIHPSPTPVLRVRLDAGAAVAMASLTPALLATLKHAASMLNPAFYERQRRRFSTWGIARHLHSFDETTDGDLVLPRGLADLLITTGREAGSDIEIDDRRATGTAQQFTLASVLREDQTSAVSALAGSHDHAVLVAPPGAGKTVIASALSARYATSTLVLVDRKALANQWRARLSEHLGITAGQLGGGRTKLRGGMTATERRNAMDNLDRSQGPLLVVATGPYVGEGFDCPALDTLFLAAPIAFKGRLVQYVGRILRATSGKHTVEVHDYHDVDTPVLASSLRKRRPGYRSLGFTGP